MPVHVRKCNYCRLVKSSPHGTADRDGHTQTPSFLVPTLRPNPFHSFVVFPQQQDRKMARLFFFLLTLSDSMYSRISRREGKIDLFCCCCFPFESKKSRQPCKRLFYVAVCTEQRKRTFSKSKPVSICSFS